MALWSPRRRAQTPDVLPASTPPPDFVPRGRADLARNGFSEQGAIGTTYYNGFLSGEEYLTELQGLNALPIYDRMWRSDGDIGAIKRALTQPILRAKWGVKEASQDDLDVEIAQFCHDNIFNGMAGTWREHLVHALFMYRDGYSVSEKVWTHSDDGKNRLLKLAPRLSRTIYRWFVNPDGTIDHVQQLVWEPGPRGEMGMQAFRDIDGGNLVVYTLDKEGANYQGQSVLRNMYKHSYLKDCMYEIDAIAGERNALGIPTFREPQNASPDARQTAADILAGLHAHQRQYVLEPFGWEFRMEGVSGATRDLMPSIQHHSLEMAKSVLATFLNLDNVGSYARDLSETSLFLQNLHAVCDIITETLNRDVIRPLVDMNWKVDRYPTIVCEELDKRDIGDILKGIAQLYEVGAITNDTATENAVRQQINFPAKTPDGDITDSTTVNPQGQGQAASDTAPEAEDAPEQQPAAAPAGGDGNGGAS